MAVLLAYVPAFAVMLVLMAASFLFSAAEAAFFSLSREDRCRLAEGGRLAKLAAELGERSEPLLNSILLGNLIVNLLAFTLSAVVVFRLQESGYGTLAGGVALASLFGVIIFCEILPKDLAILAPRFFAVLFALPISFVVRMLKPLLPAMKTINILSRRLIWPDFEAETLLRIGDLEKAVSLSREDATLLKQEQRVLQNIVLLSEIRVEELMRPRSHIKIFKPPVSLDRVAEELNGRLPRSGFLLISEPDSDEIASAVSLNRLTAVPPGTLWQSDAAPILCVPWSISVAEAFEQLRKSDKEIAAVLNEFGETIGVLTIDDIFQTLFIREQSRSRSLFNRHEIRRINSDRWEVNSLTGLRRLQRKFGIELPGHSSVTVGGLLREILERLPRQGDVCRWGPFEFHVAALADGNDDMVIELRVDKSGTTEPGS